MTNSASVHVCVIGLGSMGLGMAASMVRKGLSVSGTDINREAIARLGEAGGKGCPSIAEAADGADIVLSVVVNAAQTETVLFGDGGAAARMKPGGVIISSATMSPADARRLASMAAERGLLYLDAPVSGGATGADAGALTVMASGTPQAFAAARPALDGVARTVYELGDEAGIGASFKMVNQLLAGVHLAAACEAMAFAAKLGLDLPTVYEVITKSAGNSWMFENRMPNVLAGDYASRSATSIFTKDMGIVSDMGRKENFPLPAAATALQLFLMTAAAGMNNDGDTSVARMFGKLAGLDLPEKKG